MARGARRRLAGTAGPQERSDEDLWLLLSKRSGGLRQALERALKAENLRLAHYEVLRQLVSRPDSRQGRLAEAAGVDSSTMVSVLDDFEGLGYAERRPDDRDRRRRIVRVTDRGIAAFGRVRPIVAEVEDEFFACLDLAGQQSFRRLLAELPDESGRDRGRRPRRA